VPAREPPDRSRVLVVDGPIAAGDVALLCRRLSALAAAGADDVVCDVRALAPDALSIDALARLQLTARRLGCRFRLRHASRELAQLLSFFGLADVVALCPERERQPEEREHPRRVEERVDRDDAPA
jgi:anti-anti-sigma regulatory factor